jgi:hypothetical protein
MAKDKLVANSGFGDVAPLEQLGRVNYSLEQLKGKAFVVTDYQLLDSERNNNQYIRFEGTLTLTGELFECSTSYKMIMEQFMILKPEHFPVAGQVYQRGKSFYLGNPS